MATIKACKDCRTLHVEREPYAWVALCDCYDGAPDSPPQKMGHARTLLAALEGFDQRRAVIEGDE